MIKLKSLLGKPQSPSFQLLAEIMQAKGADRVLRQHRSIRFPNGTGQILRRWTLKAPFNRW